MEPKFNTSFIPKKSLQDVGTSSQGKFVGRRDVQGPTFYLAVFLFIVTFLASIGLFVYSQMIAGKIEEKMAILEKKKAIFSSDEIGELIRLDTRLKNAKQLVSEHLALTELFSYLEKITLKRVQYTELKFEGMPNQTNMITLTGKAKNFQDVALQMEQYRLNDTLRSPIAKELERSEEFNDVQFSVDVLTGVELVSFSAMIQRGANTLMPPGAQTSQTAVTTDAAIISTTTPTSETSGVQTYVDGAQVIIGGSEQSTNPLQEPTLHPDNDTGAFINTR